MHIAREPRHKVLIRATLRASGPRTEVCVRDISARGMMIQAGNPPARGTYVDVEWAGHQIVGIVVWRRDHRFGVNTCERINVAAMLLGVSAEVLAPARRSAEPARRAGAARAVAGRMEFAVIALLAALLIASLGVTVFQTLSRPFAAVSDVLGH